MNSIKIEYTRRKLCLIHFSFQWISCNLVNTYPKLFAGIKGAYFNMDGPQGIERIIFAVLLPTPLMLDRITRRAQIVFSSMPGRLRQLSFVRFVFDALAWLQRMHQDLRLSLKKTS